MKLTQANLGSNGKVLSANSIHLRVSMPTNRTSVQKDVWTLPMVGTSKEKRRELSTLRAGMQWN